MSLSYTKADAQHDLVEGKDRPVSLDAESIFKKVMMCSKLMAPIKEDTVREKVINNYDKTFELATTICDTSRGRQMEEIMTWVLLGLAYSQTLDDIRASLE